MTVALGTQGWAYADWVGPMYDAGTRPDGFLRAYAREFGTVEVDATFYGTPEPQRVRRWAAQVPPAFTFALKLPREITHERRLVRCGDQVAAFASVAAELGPQLEAILIQLAPDFSPAEADALDAFVAALPPGPRWALEVRDPGWFEPPALTRLRGTLAAREVALALTDGTFVPLEAMLAELAAPCAPHAYLRWLGRRDAVARFDAVIIDRRERIARWAAAIGAAAPRLRRISGYVNNHYAGHSPQTVRDLLAALGVAHARPPRIEQPSLF